MTAIQDEEATNIIEATTSFYTCPLHHAGLESIHSRRKNKDASNAKSDDFIEISLSTSSAMDNSDDQNKHFTHMLGGFYSEDSSKILNLTEITDDTASDSSHSRNMLQRAGRNTNPFESDEQCKVEQQNKSTCSGVLLAACDMIERLVANRCEDPTMDDLPESHGVPLTLTGGKIMSSTAMHVVPQVKEECSRCDPIVNGHLDDDNKSCAMSSITTTNTAGPPRGYGASSSVFFDGKPSDGFSGGVRNVDQPSCFKIIGLARQEWPMILLAFVLMVVGESWTLYIPLLLRDDYDYLVDPNRTSKERMSEINRIMSIVLIINSFGILASFARTSIMAIAGERVVARLRNRLYEALLHQEIPFFDNHDTSELFSRLRTDPALLQQATSMALPEIVLASLKLCVSFGIMASISIKLTLLIIFLLAIIMCCCSPLGKMIDGMKQAYEHVLDQAQAHSAEALAGIRTVQAFAAEGKENERYKNLIGDPDMFQWCWPTDHLTRRTAYSLGFFKCFAVSGYNNLIFGVGFGAIYASIWYGFKLVTDGEITLGELVCFQMYTFLIGASLGHCRFVFQYIEAEGAAGRIFHFLNRIPAVHSKPTSGNDHTSKRMQQQQNDSTVRDSNSIIQRPESMNGAIDFNNVHFFHPFQPGVLALYNFSLSISPNTTVAMVGDSVAGYSAVSLLQRFYDVSYRTGGSITVDGIDVRDLDIHWLRTQIGYVQHDPQFFGMSTIRENITYGYPSNLEVSQDELESVCRLANAHDFISSWPSQYDTYIGGAQGVQLSSDQRQCIAIARAILTNPRILLLEEVPSAILAETENDHLVQQAIENAITGRTALILANRLSTMQRADQIVVMNNHQIVDIADHHTLLQRCSRYQDIVRRKSLANAKLTLENNNNNNNSLAQPISASALCTGNLHALGMEVSVRRAFVPTDSIEVVEEAAEEEMGGKCFASI